MMGIRLLRRVLESSPSEGTDRLVLLVLAEHANDKTGECWPSVELIAREAAMSSRSAQRAIEALVERDEVAVELHGAPLPKLRRQHRPNLFRLPLVVTPETPLANPSGDSSDTTTAGPVVTAVSPLNGSSGDSGGIPVVTPLSPESLKNQKTLPSAPSSRSRLLKAKATDDPLTERAHKLAKLAFEQKPKPMTPGGFAAVLGIIKAALEAGHHDDDVSAAIMAGDVAWSKRGLAFAIGRAKRSNTPLSYDPPQVVYR